MVPAVGQLVKCLPSILLERLVGGAVVVLDGWEGPPSGDGVAGQDFPLPAVGPVFVAGLAQQVHRPVQFEIGASGRLVEGVQVATGPRRPV
jgi:hypothetical protein